MIRLHEWSACRRGRYLHNKQQTQETNSHALSCIRTRDPRNAADADLRPRTPGHRDRLTVLISWYYLLLGRRLEMWSAVKSLQNRNARVAQILSAKGSVFLKCLIMVILKCRNMPHCTIQQCRTNTYIISLTTLHYHTCRTSTTGMSNSRIVHLVVA